jgi:hypothetical protein
MPPKLVLLDAGEAAYTRDSGYSHAELGGGDDSDVATLVGDEPRGEFSLSPATERSEKPSYGFDVGGAAATATKTRPSVTTKPRPKKPAKNPVFEVLKIVLGGAAAIPIALLILWWAFGKDPFEAGPLIAKYVPAIVPAKFHGGPAVNKNSEDGDDGAAVAKKSVNKSANNKQGSNKQGGNKQPKKQELPKLENLGNPFDLTPDTPALDPGPTIPTDPLDPGLQIDPLMPDLDPQKSSQTPPNDQAGVRNAPQYTAAELGEAIDNAAKAVQAWQQAKEGDDKVALARNLYTELSKLGEKITFVDNTDRAVENHLPAVREMLIGFQAEPDIMNMINRVAPAWLGMDVQKRGTKGILLVGTVKSIVHQGQMFETRLELEDAEHTVVTVASTVDPAGHYKVDNRLLVLGVVIEEPSLQLIGYEGTDNSLVFGGYPVTLANL